MLIPFNVGFFFFFLMNHLFIYHADGFYGITGSIVKRGIVMKNDVPPMWKLVSRPLKEQARQWFINRAIVKNIDWNGLTNEYKKSVNFEKMLQLKQNLENITMKYPEYYLQAFHGYDEGNMNWLAAQEAEAASLSMCANYWKNVCAMDSEKWVRYNATNNIKQYIRRYSDYSSHDGAMILDVGCSGGISTEYILRGFPNASSVYGLDLSPYFVAVSSFRANKHNEDRLNYVHGNAEQTQFKNETFDIIICNFLFHEVPPDATRVIFKEMLRLLKDGGILAVVDLDPEVIKGDKILSQFRKWAFEVTEPHIYSYYNSNMTNYFLESGFIDLVKKSNDPINAVWMGRKPVFEYSLNYGYDDGDGFDHVDGYDHVDWGC